MAWRIDEFVVRGEIDNRTRDRVTGRIWFAGRDEPIELDLAGNAWRDLAGRHLEFVNPQPKTGDLTSLATQQSGVIGDCTASRKVKVPDIPMDQIAQYYAAKKKWTWHWGNCLYLEWFSQRNGRVVIESASYQLTVSPDHAWDMTAAGEEEQQRANARALTDFMARLGHAGPDHPTVTPVVPPHSAAPGPKSSDGSPPSGSADDVPRGDEPMTEAEAEKIAEEHERLLDRIQARMERQGDDADFERILEEELERRRQERGEAPLTPEQEAERDAQMEAIDRAMAEAAANPNPELDARLDRRHPLAERARELTLRLMREPENRGWIPDDAGEEHPLVDLASASSKASAKLAGALNGDHWPPEIDFCANTLVRLKRARSYLDDALRAAEGCREGKLGTPEWWHETQRELDAIGHGCDVLIGELRARLKRGRD